MERANKKTIEYLNNAKFLAIFLVVFCHITMLKNDGIIDNVAMLFAWVCVPLFFLVNGALLFNKNLDFKKHYKKILKIYIISVIWRIIYLIFSDVILEIDITKISRNTIFKYIFLFGNIAGVNTGHLYFIEALIGIYLIFPLLYINFKNEDGKKFLIILCIILFVFTYGINATDFLTKLVTETDNFSIKGLSAISVFGKYANFLLFFILGAFLHSKSEKIAKIKRVRIISFIVIILSLVSLIFVKYTINNTIRWEGIYLKNGYERLSTFIMAIATFIFIQNIHIKNKHLQTIINEIGTCTLGIYYTHIPILQIFSKYIYIYILIDYRGFTMNILKTIITILIGYCLTKIMRKILNIKDNKIEKIRRKK